jgi:hypothetical protein
MAGTFKIGKGWAGVDPSSYIHLFCYTGGTSGYYSGFWKTQGLTATPDNTNNYTPPAGKKLIITGFSISGGTGFASSGSHFWSLFRNTAQCGKNVASFSPVSAYGIVGSWGSSIHDESPLGFVTSTTGNVADGLREFNLVWGSVYIDAGIVNGQYIVGRYGTTNGVGNGIIITGFEVAV